jgi:hypothetical protein
VPIGELAAQTGSRYFTGTGILTVLDGPIKLDGILLIVR